ncbi:hypothetical protein SODALDRAFT_220325 [Sodiomyces alkalinus F11]|uniref:Uncharacterized protein n=1 Tax=Sodiomyces alkalinus (strain CBS 110278 / VKM F-3762 / F11) TaxID=1314773 RepID=A0A3N2PQ30_SODAK|nr:hypothetical protein SODALDRAFT_220325 [Sodiomyces alkalinus F11]ROT36476.1 hypothetical protein SODALDRAFT_220325 [Sodiomyces alkalinus F11]
MGFLFQLTNFEPFQISPPSGDPQFPYYSSADERSMRSPRPLRATTNLRIAPRPLVPRLEIVGHGVEPTSAAPASASTAESASLTAAGGCPVARSLMTSASASSRTATSRHGNGTPLALPLALAWTLLTLLPLSLTWMLTWLLTWMLDRLLTWMLNRLLAWLLTWLLTWMLNCLLSCLLTRLLLAWLGTFARTLSLCSLRERIRSRSSDGSCCRGGKWVVGQRGRRPTPRREGAGLAVRSLRLDLRAYRRHRTWLRR